MKKLISTLLASFSLLALPAYARHNNDPMVLFACNGDRGAEGARALVDMHADSATTNETMDQYVYRQDLLLDREYPNCARVYSYIDELTPSVRMLFTLDTPTILTGMTPKDSRAKWSQATWHIEMLTAEKSFPGEYTAHYVIIKKSLLPTQQERPVK